MPRFSLTRCSLRGRSNVSTSNSSIVSWTSSGLPPPASQSGQPSRQRPVGQQTEVFSASTETDIERAFPAIAQRYLGALLVFVTGDPFFFATRKYLVALAASYAIPTIYWAREYVDQGRCER
jgi:hypothetical protein